MKYNFGEKKNTNKNIMQQKLKIQKKKLKHNLVIPHTTQNSKELGRSHILQAHVKVQRCIYRFKKKCIC